MKLFAIIFGAVLFAGLALWGIISSTDENERSQLALETNVKRIIAANDHLIQLAETHKPHDMAEAEASIKRLRDTAKLKQLPDLLRKHALESADEYERAIAKWR